MAPSVASLIQSFSPKSPVAEQLPVDGSAVPKTDENDKAHEVDKDEAETLPGEVSSADTSSSDVSIPSTDENTVVTFAEVRRKEFLSRFHAYVEGMTFPDDPAGPGGINHPSKLPYSWDDEVEFIQELQDGQEIPDGLTGNAAKREWLSMLWRHHKDVSLFLRHIRYLANIFFSNPTWDHAGRIPLRKHPKRRMVMEVMGIMGVAEVMMMTRG